MTAKTHSQAVKMAAVYLASQTSLEEAGKVFGVPKRTVGRWTHAITLPDEGGDWSAIEAVLLAQVAEKSARGDAKNLVALSTAAGIASRNRRFATLIAREEAKQAEREETNAATARDIEAELAHRAAIEEAKERIGADRLDLLRDWLEWAGDPPADPPAVLIDVTPPSLDVIAVLDHFGSLDADTAAAARAALDQYRADKADQWSRRVAQLASVDSDRRLIDEAHQLAALLETTDAT